MLKCLHISISLNLLEHSEKIGRLDMLPSEILARSLMLSSLRDWLSYHKPLLTDHKLASLQLILGGVWLSHSINYLILSGVLGPPNPYPTTDVITMMKTRIFVSYLFFGILLN